MVFIFVFIFHFFFVFFVNYVEETHTESHTKKIESIRLTEAIVIPLEREGTKVDIQTYRQTDRHWFV